MIETHHLPVAYTFLLPCGPPAVLRKEGGEGGERGEGEVRNVDGRGEGRERKRGRREGRGRGGEKREEKREEG